MYISKIHIKNFKGIKELTLHCNKGLNILVGENSAGKSTIIEAIRLWRMALDEFTQVKEHKLFSCQSKFLDKQNLEFLRIMDLKDIFCKESAGSEKKVVTICLFFRKEDESERAITFRFKQPTQAKESLRLEISENKNKLEEFFGNFKSLLYLLYLSPIFNLVNSEPIYEPKYFQRLQRKGLGNQVLRNIILALSEKGKLDQLNESLQEIFPDLIQFEKIVKKSNSNKDESNSKKSNSNSNKDESNSNKDGLLELIAKGDPADLGSQGSGVLQTIYLLASIYYLERKDLHIALLLDEPDSHLNGKVQRALVTVLRDLSQNENMQTFIVTHNEKLIYSAENNELLHIEKNESDIKPLPSENYLKTLIALDYYDLNKHWLMVEGVTDQIILDKAFQVLYEKPLFGYFNVKVASGAKNLNGLLGKCIESSEFIQDKTRTVIGLFDGDREGIGQCDGVKQTENVKCLILPMPEHRENFKGHLEIEHYFSDNFVETNQLKGEPVAVDSQVYRPKKLKVCELEKALDFLDAQFFEPFRLIFEAIAEKSNNQEFNEIVCRNSSKQAVA